ncbi:DUF2290 domain-containing protein [Gloeothece verrucosa]|uniref:DUF2290 domain-containing protein n=1 Tax=Gloeothece verrucosa (strain PCC 7822) TaxID=497965 RepID=E0UCJ5_GLOV7|nr:DUF2290 domain-containing protein [Gloeothece verrucosa]ADN14066.1 Protein of unknown function DUF2290 [Gloeothece verrucosa PCC 7822]
MKINHQNILKEVNEVTSKLISVDLSVQQNFPSCQTLGNNIYQIAYAGMSDLSIALKNLKYEEIYDELHKNKNYNIKMIDGALIQLLYTYQGSTLIAHRLAFFPSPYLESFQNEPEIYIEDEIYADILDKNIMVVPIRFDYDPKNFKELEHPHCHLTLGQFKNCRIPVCSPLTPNVFISFILSSFYNTAYQKYSQELNLNKVLFDETITQLEKEILHIAIF